MELKVMQEEIRESIPLNEEIGTAENADEEDI